MADTQSPELAKARAALLKSGSRKRVPITYKGVDLDLIQPTIGEIDQMRKEAADGVESLDGFSRIMIKYSVLRGTDIHPLTEEDAPALSEQPWNKEVTGVVEAFGKLSDIDVGNEVKNSGETAS